MHYLPEEPGATSRDGAYPQMARLLQYRAVSNIEAQRGARRRLCSPRGLGEGVGQRRWGLALPGAE